MTDYPPTHLLRVHVPDPTPDENGNVRLYRPTTGFYFSCSPAADLTPIPPEDLPIEVRFPVGSVWRVEDGVEVEITDTREDSCGYVGCLSTHYDEGTIDHGSVHPDALATAERVR